VRREDATPFAPEVLARRVRPLALAAGLAAVLAAPLVWLALVHLWLAGVWAALSAVVCFAVFRLAREVHAQDAELVRLRSTDALTGLPNRRVWQDALPRELARSIRNGSPVAIALIDVDLFRGYNDSYGHQAADLLLKEMAAMWPGELRESDLLARHGGDEFAMLLPDCGVTDVRAVVEKVRVTTPPGITCSAGVATWDGIEPPDVLVARAAEALVAAKADGRDQTVVAGSRSEPAV
jgi:diguanylate cyclase (GGDEF)-like protein